MENASLSALTELFRHLGAADPESWAASQVREDIPQLERYLFLRQAWRQVAGEEDTAWIERVIADAERSPNAPFAGLGRSLRSLRALGAPTETLAQLVRAAQAEVLFGICYLLDDPGVLEPEVADTAWGLFSVDEAGRPLRRIGCLHESVLETDPSRREARPKTRLE